MKPRPYIYRRWNPGLEAWAFAANVRDERGKVTYLASYPTKEEAEAVADHYLRTGERPPPVKRGRKPGQHDRVDRQKPRPYVRAPRAPKPPKLPPTARQERATANIEFFRQLARRVAA